MLFPATPPRDDVPGWFTSIGQVLLTGCRLAIAGQPYRIVEIEFYYFSADHPDPFCHRHPDQQRFGSWYFHRQGSSYRNGTFKGLDIALGNVTTFGGILLRSVETPEGKIVDGPCLVVEEILRRTERPTIGDFVRSNPGIDAWDRRGLISLIPAPVEDRPIWQSRRIGLTDRRDPHRSYRDRMYRYLTEPRLIRKGRRELIESLLSQGLGPTEIATLTGSPRSAIARIAG